MICPHCGLDTDKPKHSEAPAPYKFTDGAQFRGDFHEYPESLWPWAETLRDEWGFTLPPKPHKRQKSQYSFWIMAMEELRAAAAEFGLKALAEVRKEFEDYMAKHNGLAPYTVAGPQSLLNVVTAKVAVLRTNLMKSTKSAPDPMAAFNRYLERTQND